MIRAALAIFATAGLSGCLTLPNPSPAPTPIECAPAAMLPCQALKYAFPPGEIVADAAAAVALAERKAWCECAIRHQAVLNCVNAHNGRGREDQGPPECKEQER